MKAPRRFARHYVLGNTTSAYPFLVYVLYCPIEKQIRYVGYTSGVLYQRLHQHCTDSRHYAAEYLTPKEAWIRRLAASGLLPFMRCIAGFHDKDEAKAYEAHMIRHIRTKRPLYNTDKRAQ